MVTKVEQTHSSTYRESAAIQFVLDAFSPLLTCSQVEWFNDNQGEARIMQVGSMQFNLHILGSDIFFLFVPMLWRADVNI